MLQVYKPACDTRYFDARETCPICDSPDSTILYNAPYARDPVRGFVATHYRHQGEVDWSLLEGTDFVLSACQECDSIYQRHAPNAFLTDNIYNVMISPDRLFRSAMRYLTVDSFESVAGELSHLFRLAGKDPGAIRFLDYGLGYGRWARVAAAMGARVYATEISPGKIAFARTLGIQNIADDDLASEPFDIIHTEQVFEHLTAPGETFARLSRALAPDGIFKVAIPPAGAIRRRLASHGMIDTSPLEYTWHPNPETQEAAKHTDYVCVVPMEHLTVFSRKAMEILAGRNRLRLIGSVRRESVPLSFLDRRTVARSLVRVAKVTLRPVFRRDSGYYLFRR